MDSSDEKPLPLPQGATPGSTVSLWDGKAYPRRLLESACPGLAEYAATHPALEETMPDVDWRLVRVWGKIAAWTLPLIGSPIYIGAALWAVGEGGMDGFLAFLGVVIVFGGFSVLLAVIWLLGVRAEARRVRPSILTHEGELELRSGGKTHIVRLDECCWFVGKVSDMRLECRDHHLLPDQVLIIELPTPVRRGRHIRVPVGFTPEKRAIWEAFLTLAEVPKNAN